MELSVNVYYNAKSLENQFIYPNPKGSKLIFFAPPGAGVNEENQCNYKYDSRYSPITFCQVPS